MKRQAIHLAVLAAINAGRKNAIEPANQAFATIKDDALPEAARPAIVAAKSTLCGLVGAQLTEIPGDALTAVNAAVDAVVAEELAAQLEGKVRETLAGKLTAGELVAKADHEQAVQAATKAAEQQGRTAALNEVKVTNERRTQVTACGLAATEADLAGDDAAFTARLETAKARHGEKAKLSHNGVAFADHLNPFAPESEWTAGFKAAEIGFKNFQAALAKVPDGSGGGSGSGGATAPKFG